MQMLDDHRSINKTPQVMDYLHHLVLGEPAITSVVTAIEPDPQLWGSSGLHFSARHIGSGDAVLLKVNVAANQLWWTRALADTNPALLPGVYATGDHVGTKPLGWVIWEQVAGGLHPGWRGREFDMLLEAGVTFQIASRALASAAQAAGVLGELRVENLATWLEEGIRRAAPEPAQHVRDRLSDDWAWVTSVCETEVCHGDLHMANALCRSEPPDGTALLIDHHPTRMPWACEAAKPEILNAEPDRAGCRGLIAKQAAIRARHALSAPTGADLARLQAIVLGWWAIFIWGAIGPSPDPNWRAKDTWQAENRAYITAAAGANS